MMFKPISAGLMCLGLATLGVTMLRGEVVVEEEAPKSDILFYRAEPLEDAASEFEIEVAGEIGLEGKIEDAPGNIAIDVADIKTDIAEIHFSDGPQGQGDPVGKGLLVKLAHPPGTIDPATRESLEKIIKQLREDEAGLREAGRHEEAAQKMHTAVRLEAVIRGHGPFPQIAHFRTGGKPFNVAVPPPALAARIQAERAEVEARLAELQAKRAAIQAQRPEAPELAEIDKAIQNAKQGADQRFNQFRVARRKLADANVAGNFLLVDRFDPNSGEKHGINITSSADSLMQRADALHRAADILSKAGLEEKAQELKAKGEKIRAEAAEMQAQFHVNFVPHGGPPADLHRTLNELREQVQQLRKEVAELRTLLEKKP